MTTGFLQPRRVERIWGRRDLPDWVPGDSGLAQPIGELWFEQAGAADHELLVKLLFTAERLSIQVHPDDAAARAIGHQRGKDEAWLVLDAEPGAVIGLGLRHQVSREELRAAALSGAIEQLIDWRPVARGEIYYSPAGTVHAIGPGLTIMEIQQNLDLTTGSTIMAAARAASRRRRRGGRPQALDAGFRAARDRSRPRIAPRRRSVRARALAGGDAARSMGVTPRCWSFPSRTAARSTAGR